MRYFGIALTAAFVTFTAGTASAQQPLTGTLSSDGKTMKVVGSDGSIVDLNINGTSGTMVVVTTPGSAKAPKTDLAKLLAVLKLSSAQQDSVAKLGQAKAAEPAKYDDASYGAAIRALLTPDQRKQLDQRLEFNKAIDKKREDAAKPKQ